MATPFTGKMPLPEDTPHEESTGAAMAPEAPTPTRKPAVQKILEELRREHANLCAAIEALESLVASDSSGAAPARRHVKPIDDSWIDAARVARTKSPASEEPS